MLLKNVRIISGNICLTTHLMSLLLLTEKSALPTDARLITRIIVARCSMVVSNSQSAMDLFQTPTDVWGGMVSHFIAISGGSQSLDQWVSRRENNYSINNGK